MQRYFLKRHIFYKNYVFCRGNAARYAAGSLSVSLSLTGGEKIQVSLGEVDVPKVSASDFMVADVVVATSGIPALDVEDGYFE